MPSMLHSLAATGLMLASSAFAGPTEDALAFGEKALKVGEIQSALTTWLNAYNERANAKTEKDETCAKLLWNLGTVASQVGSNDMAKTCFEKLVALRRELNGRTHVETAKAEASLLLVLANDDKNMEAALALAKESVEALPDNDEKLARSRMNALVNLGGVLLRNKDRIPANEAYLKALEFSKKYPEQTKGLTAICHENMATIAQFFGRTKDQKAHLKEMMAEQEKLGEPLSEKTLNTRLMLADGLQSAGDSQQARGEYEKVIEAIGGSKNAMNDTGVRKVLVAAQYRLAVMESQLGNRSRTLVLLKSARKEGEAVFGKESLSMSSVYLDLAKIALLEKEYDTGLDAYRAILALRRKHLGPEHKDTIETELILREVTADVERVRAAKK
jgi:tetratricopeptide (TPR) repeat protein